MTMKTKHDDGLEWLREIRRKMAKQFNYDPKKAGEYYRKMARRPGVKLYRREDHLAAVK
jgi:IS30 family transposase